MANDKFVLSRDEIAREVHRALKELYPEQKLEGNIIHKMLIEIHPAGTGFMFPIRDYAFINNLDQKEFLLRLFRELSIESEKNLHDKFLFEMSLDDHCIYFKMINKES
jgi:hypothetical protein